jgi:hypothetical protein
MTKHLRGTMLALGTALMLSTSTARADEWNQETILTINQPMVVPGATLAPGTYIFKLADENGSRSVVNIFRDSDRELVATVNTIRMHRTDRTGDLTLKVALSEGGAAPTMKGWFYPGTMDGHEFLYPKEQRRAMANAETVDIPVTPRG